MRRTTIRIKGFYNTKKECIGYVNMPIEVGGKCVNKKIYICQEKLPYNLLLGRPWIHKLKVINSTLH